MIVEGTRKFSCAHEMCIVQGSKVEQRSAAGQETRTAHHNSTAPSLSFPAPQPCRTARQLKPLGGVSLRGAARFDKGLLSGLAIQRANLVHTSGPGQCKQKGATHLQLGNLH